MEGAKRKALEAAGWRVADAADFLEMDSEERQRLDARVELTKATRRFAGRDGVQEQMTKDQTH